MNNTLRNFYMNESEREAVKLFLLENLKELAWDRAFKNETVEGIYEAKELIERSFNKLDELYGKIDVVIINNSR